ncbi:MAG TPA: histidine kinase [Nocardioidaceae bacterium]|nr:histidine kinase [Nocardioidaceae bacterium]
MGAVLGGLAVLAGLAGAVLHAVNASAGRVVEPSFWLMGLAAALAYGGAALVLRASPARWLHLVLGAVGLMQGVALVATEWSLAAPDLPATVWLVWLGSWAWAPAYVAVVTVLPLLLPEGTLPSRGWRPAMWLAGAAVVLVAGFWAFTPYELQDHPEPLAAWTNPVGVAALGSGPWPALLGAGLVGAVVTAVASLVVRWRRAAATERQQLKWVLLGVGATVLLLAAGRVVPAEVAGALVGLAMLPLPAAVVAAALRHGLWGVDLVISRTLVYVGLAVVVATGYVAASRVLGEVLGGGTTAQVLAAVGVALLVLPLHTWLRRGVNQLVHGGAEEPLAVLVRTGDRLEAATSPDDLADRVFPSVVEQVSRSLHARGVVLELRDGTVTRHGADAPDPASALAVPLVYAGETLGTLSAWRPGGFGWGEQRVMEDLARQAAVAVHTVLLAREARLARETTVLAREEERRRLRRDLHDGVGPALAALALQVETARDLVVDDPSAAAALLDRLVPRVNATVADVRAVVHDLRPPMVDELGLAGAVREMASAMSTSRTRVRSEVADLGDLPAAVEVAAFRIAGEAVTNAVRHAGASLVDVHLVRVAGALRLEVRDDGSGRDGRAPEGVGTGSMAARAEELGGRVETSTGGWGTSVVAVLPSEVP